MEIQRTHTYIGAWHHVALEMTDLVSWKILLDRNTMEEKYPHLHSFANTGNITMEKVLIEMNNNLCELITPIIYHSSLRITGQFFWSF
jgi:hypothetical protein